MTSELRNRSDRRFRVSRSRGASSLKLLLLLFLLVSPAEAATSYSDSQALLQRLEQRSAMQKALRKGDAGLRVIVTIDTLRRQVLDRSGITQREQRQASGHLRRMQQSLLSQLIPGDVEQARFFRFVPQLVMRVKRRALLTLLNNPFITVSEDRPYRLFLDSSVPVVYPSQAISPYKGGGWAVAVLDTGVDKSHPFISGRVIAEACFSTNDAGAPAPVSSLCPGAKESSFVEGSGENCDILLDQDCDHGTRVAGVVAGAGQSFDGVAPSASIISVQVASRVDDPDSIFNDCDGETSCIRVYPSDVIQGLEHVYDLRTAHKIAAVNLSLGQGLESGTCDTQPEAEIIQYLRSAGIAVVVAAGDDGATSQIAVPACVDAATAVGASTDADGHYAGSNVSTALDLYAPGENINSSVPGSGFSIGNGTSLAAPHVAGAFAVVKERAPWLSVNRIEALFKENGPEISASWVSHRRIDIDGVLADVVDPPPDLMFPIRGKDGKIVVIYL